MKLLALDTSTEACSAALVIDGEVIEQYRLAPRGHASLILPMIEALLAEAQVNIHHLDAIAFGRGPGAFVGVRIATGVTQGIAYAADLPVVPVSSLAALAQGSEGQDGERVLAAIDARMNEVYWGCYAWDDSGLVAPVGDEVVCDPARVPLPPDDGCVLRGVGTGWQRYADVLAKRVDVRLQWEGQRYPRARHVAKLGRRDYLAGRCVDAVHVLPTYLRNRVANKK